MIAVGDSVWNALITGTGAVVLAWIGLVANRNAARAAVHAEQVRQDLKVSSNETKEKLIEIAEVGEKTHTLVNSNMAAQLKIAAVALRRLAANTSNPEDIAAAELAEKLLKEHEVKQASVDAKEKQ